MKVKNIVSVLVKRPDCGLTRQKGKDVLYRVVGGDKKYAHFGPDNNGEISQSKARGVLVNELMLSPNVADDILRKA